MPRIRRLETPAPTLAIPLYYSCIYICVYICNDPTRSWRVNQVGFVNARRGAESIKIEARGATSD